VVATRSTHQPVAQPRNRGWGLLPLAVWHSFSSPPAIDEARSPPRALPGAEIPSARQPGCRITQPYPVPFRDAALRVACLLHRLHPILTRCRRGHTAGRSEPDGYTQSDPDRRGAPRHAQAARQPRRHRAGVPGDRRPLGRLGRAAVPALSPIAGRGEDPRREAPSVRCTERRRGAPRDARRLAGRSHRRILRWRAAVGAGPRGREPSSLRWRRLPHRRLRPRRRAVRHAAPRPSRRLPRRYGLRARPPGRGRGAGLHRPSDAEPGDRIPRPHRAAPRGSALAARTADPSGIRPRSSFGLAGGPGLGVAVAQADRIGPRAAGAGCSAGLRTGALGRCATSTPPATGSHAGPCSAKIGLCRRYSRV